MTKINPTILKGTRDFLPQDMVKRNKVTQKIRNIFQKYGYDQIETPIICPGETILGKYGGEGDRLTYNFKDAGGRSIALPYDLTVPFARFVAANWRDLPMPFKRYQIQRVWRAEKPQKGRLREFYQCDIDIIGTKSLIADAEIARVVYEVFREIGMGNVIIKINSRRLMNEILTSFDVPEEKSLEVIRLIDKLDKIGEEKAVEELEVLKINKAKEILEIIKPGKSNKETLKKLSKFDTPEIETFLKYCSDLAIPEGSIQFDPSLARGLDYYTGITYEVISPDTKLGSLCGGGRYDDLCSLFSDEDFSGVGVAFGFERIMLALEELGKFDDVKANSEVLVTLFDKSMIDQTIKIYSTLQEAGIASEMYLRPDKLAKQFKYADKKRIQFVAIFGQDEEQDDTITIKNMVSGKQKAIPREQLVKYLNGFND